MIMTIMISIVVLLFIINFNLNSIFGYNYCQLESEYCKTRRHIVCHPLQMKQKALAGNEEFGSEYAILPMTARLRKAIVQEHNKVRNSLACGEVPDKENKMFPPAAHMRELKWDRELEYIASKHSELCVFDHDECRVSSKFPYAGQNLAVKYASETPDMNSLVTEFVKKWYAEYELATVKDVDELQGTPGIGHFTQLSNDRVTRIGCAVSKCEQRKPMNDRKMTKYLYTCDYSFSNIYGKPTYINATRPADKCSFVKSKPSANYKCLCAHSDHTWPLQSKQN